MHLRTSMRAGAHMGDVRFEPAYAAVAQAADRAKAIRSLDDDGVIDALAAASRSQDPLLANVLATEAANRMHRLSAAIDHMAEGFASLDCDGTVRRLNPAGERLLGVRREDALGRSFHALVDHRDGSGQLVPHEECRLLSVTEHGRPVEAEGEYFVRRDSSRLCVAYTSAPIRSRDEIDGIVVVFRDCEARRAHEDTLQEARRLYRSLFEHLPIPVVSLDARGTVLDANRAAETHTGRSAAEARGHRFDAFLPPEDAAHAHTLFREVMDGHTRTTCIRFQHRDGRYVRIRATGVPILQGDRVAGVHCIFQPEEAADGLPLRLSAPEETASDA